MFGGLRSRGIMNEHSHDLQDRKLLSIQGYTSRLHRPPRAMGITVKLYSAEKREQIDRSVSSRESVTYRIASYRMVENIRQPRYLFVRMIFESRRGRQNSTGIGFDYYYLKKLY